MKKNELKMKFFAAVSAMCFLYYIYAEFFTQNSISAVLRATMLLLGCVMSTLFVRQKNKSLTKDKAQKNMRKIFFVHFVLYSAFVLNITLLDSFYGRSSHFILSFPLWEIKKYISSHMNLIPFKTIMLYINGYASHKVNSSDFILNIFGNIAAFMPFGLFLPLYFPKTKNAKGFLLVMFLIVLGIETLQIICMSGTFDVDDIILNVGGAFLLFTACKTSKFKKAAAKIDLNF